MMAKSRGRGQVGANRSRINPNLNNPPKPGGGGKTSKDGLDRPDVPSLNVLSMVRMRPMNAKEDGSNSCVNMNTSNGHVELTGNMNTSIRSQVRTSARPRSPPLSSGSSVVFSPRYRRAAVPWARGYMTV